MVSVPSIVAVMCGLCLFQFGLEEAKKVWMEDHQKELKLALEKAAQDAHEKLTETLQKLHKVQNVTRHVRDCSI